jgi:pimeloyl-ACP methyl ester carboxylesterase
LRSVTTLLGVHPARRAISRALVVMLATLLASGSLTACGSDGPARTGSIEWRDCGAIQCATLAVPLDWSDPRGEQIRLSLARRPAAGRRIGVLLANPGGPGMSGIELVRAADAAFGDQVREHFDVVSWDPRGVGSSSPATCTHDLDFFYAVDRNSTSATAERANVDASRRFVESCEKASGSLLPYLSTRSTVRDMDAIRAAMGEPTISFLGYSYGTFLGALYADRYPRRVRAMVLDGAVDPAASYDDSVTAQAVGFQRALDAFLAWCDDSSDCKFAPTGDPTTAFEGVMSMLEQETLPAEIDGEQRTLGIGEANIGVATALYYGEGANGWVRLGEALNDAAIGDGSELLELSDEYTGRETGGDYGDVTDAFYAVGCLDGPAPRTAGAVEQLAKRAARAAPDFGPSTAWLGLPCTFWPVKADGRPTPVHAAGAAPILVVGTTNDPATPYEQAQALAGELDSGHLLTYDGEGHTAYGRGHSCVDRAVDEYLVTLELPPEGARCE